MRAVPDQEINPRQGQASQPDTPTALPGSVVNAASFVAQQQPRLALCTRCMWYACAAQALMLHHDAMLDNPREFWAQRNITACILAGKRPMGMQGARQGRVALESWTM
jgi:hypothetical protein